MMNYPRKCCVPGCRWEVTGNMMVYYPFPTNEQIKQKWFNALNMSADKSVFNSYICAGHFNTNDLATIYENTTENQLNAIKQEFLDSKFISLSCESFLTVNRIKEEITSDTELEDYFGSYEILDPSNMVDNKIEIPVPKLIKLEDSALSSKSMYNQVDWWTTHSNVDLNEIVAKSSEKHSKCITNMETPDERRKRKTRERVQRWRAKKALERLSNLTHQNHQRKLSCRMKSNSRQKNIVSEPNSAKNQSTLITEIETPEEKKRRMTRERVKRWRAKKSFERLAGLKLQNTHSNKRVEVDKNIQHNDTVVSMSRSLKDQSTFNSIMESREERRKRLTRERVQRWRVRQLAKRLQNTNKSIWNTDKNGIKQKYKLFDRNLLTLNRKLHLDVNGHFKPFCHIVDPLALSDDEIEMPMPKPIKLDKSNSVNITHKRISTRSVMMNTLAETVVKKSEYHSKSTNKMETSEDRRKRMNRERVRRWRARKLHVESLKQQGILRK